MMAVVAYAAIVGYQIHNLSDEQVKIRQDYSVVNSITYGLLSVNKWRDVIISSIKHRTETFALTHQQDTQMKAEIEQILHSLVDKAVSVINAPQKSIGGKLKKLAFNALVNVDKVQAQVPVFALQIMKEVKSPRSMKRLKGIATGKLQEISNQTYDSTLQATQPVIDAILAKNGVADREGFQKKADSRIVGITNLFNKNMYILLALIGVVLLLWAIILSSPDLQRTMYIMSVLFAIVLLAVGATTSMIEIDARIQSLDFTLVGEKIKFENQVLFYQSKSILSVVLLLIETHKFDAVIVGVLILIFSILFPLAKLFSTGLYLLVDKGWARGSFISYFAFKSGKWNMANVMVVAIFMAYIGFNSILTEQLQTLNMKTETFSSIAVNETSLKPGYIIFTCFVLFSLVLSVLLKKILPLLNNPATTVAEV